MSANLPISLTGRLTLDESIYLAQLHQRLILRPGFRIGLSILFSGLFCTLLSMLVQFNLQAIFLGATGLYGLYWLHLSPRVRATCSFKAHSDQMGDVTAEIESDKVKVSTESSGAWLPWTEIEYIVDSPRGLIFVLPSNRVWFFLPDRVFPNEKTRDTILALGGDRSISIRKQA